MENIDKSNHRARLILLGASNLTRAISTVVETARLALGSPLEIFGALGHGRSYGMRSSILLGARALPGILECGIWEALDERRHQGIQASRHQETHPLSPPSSALSPSLPTYALITDIGNDIIYGAAPEQVTHWVQQCIDRLAAHHATIAMTMIPIETIRAVRPWQYAIVKAALFPTRKLTFKNAIQRAGELHDRLMELSQQRGVRLIQPQTQWYGFDPIHVQMRHWPAAWCEIMDACLPPTDRNNRRATPSLARWLRLRTLTPEKWWLAGMQRGCDQPGGRLGDGTSIALF